MKKHIAIILLLAVSGFAQTRIYLKGNDGISRPVLDKNNIDYVIDSSEIVNPSVFFDLTSLPISSWTDTVGYVWLRCADSAGTDSIGGQIKWQGNPLGDGTAKWEDIDSVIAGNATGTTYVQAGKAVVNSKRYMALRFILRNQRVPAAGKKSTCRDIVLNRHERIFAR